MTDVVTGQKYILRLEENITALSRVGIALSYIQQHEGKLITIEKTAYSGRNQQIWISEPEDVHAHNYFWPQECFEPAELKFAVGEKYICDFKPDDPEPYSSRAGIGKWYGWNSTMDEWCGEILVCIEVVEDGIGARLKPESEEIAYTYAKEWVRPASWNKTIKIIKRNVLNFWPGNK